MSKIYFGARGDVRLSPPAQAFKVQKKKAVIRGKGGAMKISTAFIRLAKPIEKTPAERLETEVSRHGRPRRLTPSSAQQRAAKLT